MSQSEVMSQSQHPPLLNDKEEEEEEEEEEIGKKAIRLANAIVLPMVLKSAIELNLIDILVSEGTWLSPPEIAVRIPTDNPSAPVVLDRMLQLLASYEILTSREEGSKRVYCAGPICKFFKKEGGVEGSVGPLLLFLHDEVFMKSWYHLNDVVREGGTPFSRAYGMTGFEYAGTDERFNKVCNRAMSNHTTLVMKKILDAYRGFEGLKVLVDVGGGIGVTLNSITSKYTHLQGINFDLPHVLADAPKYPGVEHAPGDMFASVPKGDAIFLKWILHDWTDEHCLKLLKNCYEALPFGGKVIIVESIRPEQPKNTVPSHIAFEEDLFMLAVTPGGKVRNQKEFEALALSAGFSGCEVICPAYDSWVMELPKREYP